jgi:hypothetical protein
MLASGTKLCEATLAVVFVLVVDGARWAWALQPNRTSAETGKRSLDMVGLSKNSSLNCSVAKACP